VWWLKPVISAIQEAEIRKITVQGKPGQKVRKTTYQQNKPGVVVDTCNPGYEGGIGRWSQAGSRKSMRPYLKNN
jgi:hypothetical protein